MDMHITATLSPDQLAQVQDSTKRIAKLEREMNTVADLRELLDTVRRIAYELNEEILKDSNAKTEE